MANYNVGDRVRVKDRKDWATPPGYKLANSEGTVVKVTEWQEILEEFQEYVKVKIEKTSADVKVGTELLFREENLEKI
jgi:hypothetical protein